MNTRRPNIVLSLTHKNSDYQRVEAGVALEVARKYGFDLRILYAEGDPILQSQQLLNIIQSPDDDLPAAILLEPVGTGMVQVARAASRAGIGWVVLNREVDYIGQLRSGTRSPVFSVSTNHLETGKIQGRQINHLLPGGGTVLYLQGPGGSEAARLRSSGTRETLRPNIQMRALNGRWLEETAFEAVTSWLKLATSRDLAIDAVAAQNDFMAHGARKAFTRMAQNYNRRDWEKIKYIGCDGLREFGYKWAQTGILAATIVCPTLTQMAIELFAKSRMTGTQPAPVTYTVPVPYPSLTQSFTLERRATA